MKKFLTALCFATLLSSPAYAGNRENIRLASLDDVGTLVYTIPGVITYAVDYPNGTLYLPGAQASSLAPEEVTPQTMVPMYIGESGLLEENIQRIVYMQTGQKVSLADPRLEVYKLGMNGEKVRITSI